MPSCNMAEIRTDQIGLNAGGRRFEIVGEPVTYLAKNFSCMISQPANFKDALYRGYMANWMSLKISRIRRMLNT